MGKWKTVVKQTVEEEPHEQDVSEVEEQDEGGNEWQL